MLYEACLARGHRAESTIHGLEMEALQVWLIACNEDAYDLPLTLPCDFVRVGEPFENYARLGGAVMFPNDVVIRCEIHRLNGEVLDGP